MHPLLIAALSMCTGMFVAAIPLWYQSQILELEESWRKKMLAKDIRKTAINLIIVAAILTILILLTQILIDSLYIPTGLIPILTPNVP